MIEKPKSHLTAILQALLVTFLWSTSFIIIKLGLSEIPPLTYAGMRYFIAFLAFIPFILKPKNIEQLKHLNSGQIKKLFLLGLIFYALTQGTQFIGLSLLPSVTVSLMLNFTPIVVAILGIIWLNEKPTLIQWIGTFTFIIGIVVYFIPLNSIVSQGFGILVMIVGVASNALSSILGRDINRQKNISPILVTFISMGFGSVILFSAGIIKDGIPEIGIITWILLLWLALVNTAFAFTLWNKTLRSLSAMESSIINGTMLIQIAFLAWIFLGESITIYKGIGMGIAAIGALLVQLKLNPLKKS
ncbi:MAG: DMT family transporter [Melioribacteraceae bacterium]|nr:DMT family transporter [Melioribacteraceae bacterium]